MALALAVFAGCKKEKSTHEKLCGEWRLDNEQVALYVGFYWDNTFEEYMMGTDGQYELRCGKWQLDGNVLSGTYNDSEPWAYTYQLSFSGETLKMVSVEGEASENKYIRKEIPEAVKEHCKTVVKSVSAERSVSVEKSVSADVKGWF